MIKRFALLSITLMVFAHIAGAAKPIICDPSVLPFGRGILIPSRGLENRLETYVQLYKNGEPAGSKYLLIDKIVDANFNVLCNGEYIAAWERSDHGYYENYIYVRRLSPYGEPIGHEIEVAPEYRGYQTKPVIAALADGGYIISWEMENKGRDIFFRIYSSLDKPRTRIFKLERPENSMDMNAFLAGLSSGGFVVLWSRFGTDGSVTGSYVQVFNPNGLPITKPSIVTDAKNVGDMRLVRSFSDGSFVAYWDSQPIYQESIKYGRYFSASGVPITDVFSSRGDDDLSTLKARVVNAK